MTAIVAGKLHPIIFPYLVKMPSVSKSLEHSRGFQKSWWFVVKQYVHIINMKKAR